VRNLEAKSRVHEYNSVKHRTLIAEMSSSLTFEAFRPDIVKLASMVVYDPTVGVRLGAEVGAGTGTAVGAGTGTAVGSGIVGAVDGAGRGAVVESDSQEASFSVPPTH